MSRETRNISEILASHMTCFPTGKHWGFDVRSQLTTAPCLLRPMPSSLQLGFNQLGLALSPWFTTGPGVIKGGRKSQWKHLEISSKKYEGGSSFWTKSLNIIEPHAGYCWILYRTRLILKTGFPNLSWNVIFRLLRIPEVITQQG